MVETSCKKTTSLEGFLHKAHSFYPYSIRNVALILSQNPNAMECHGADEWKARGAYIKASEEALQIAKNKKCLEKALECEIPEKVYEALLKEINARKN